MRRALFPVSLLLMVALVGCASEAPVTSSLRLGIATQKPAPTPEPTLAPTPKPQPQSTNAPGPTPKPATKRQAASAYLAVANRFDRALNKLTTKYGSKSDGTSQRTMHALASKATGEFIVGLRGIEFPKASSKAAKAMIRSAAAYMRAARMASKSPDSAVLGLLASDAAKALAAGSRRAAALREDLGLRRPPADSKGRSGRRF